MFERLNWDDLKIFLAIARDGRLSTASRQLRLDPATLSRRIKRLETTLDTTLFIKGPQGYDLTQIGQELLDHASNVETAVSGIKSKLSGSTEGLSGTIRIGAPDGSANFLLPQVCAKIADENPQLNIQIVALPRVFNLSKREADIAISVDHPKSSRLSLQKIADYQLHLAAHKSYLNRHGPIASKQELSAHRIIGYIADLIFTPELDYMQELGPSAEANLSSNNFSVQMNWAQQGAGLCVVHDFALPFYPEMRRVLTDQIRLTRTFYLMRHRDEMKDEKLNRFSDQLVEKMRAEIAHLEAIAAKM